MDTWATLIVGMADGLRPNAQSASMSRAEVGSSSLGRTSEAFKQFWRDFRDTFLACCILLKIACPSIERPIDLSKVAEHARALWAGLARVAVDADFA